MRLINTILRCAAMTAMACALAPLSSRDSAAAASNDWVEVTSPNFVVVSNAGEKEARKTALRFEQIRALFRETLPIAKAHQGPVITILAVKDEKSMQEVLPEYWTKGHAHPAGLFANAMNQFYIAVQLDAQGPNPYETVYHEYYHSLTMPYVPDLPVWLSEGLADFFGNSEIEGKSATVGRPAEGLLYQLANNSMIPLDALFKVDRSSPYYNEESKVTIFYAESWALTHYLMIGDKESHRPMLMAYLTALTNGASEDEAAAKGFGDLKALQKQLDSYVRRDEYSDIIYPAPAGVADSDLKARTISEADVAAYEGGFDTVRGRSDDAKALLDRALQLDPKNPIAYQNLAITQYFLQQRPDALAAASRAIELNPSSKLARYLRAYLTFNEDPGAENPQIETDLRAAIAGNAEFAPPYSLLAIYMASQNENMPEAVNLAEHAISIEPGNADFHLALAQVLMRMQKYPEARTALMHAKESASTSRQLLQTQMYLTSLDEMEKFAQVGPRAAAAAVDGGASGNIELQRRGAGTVGEDPNALQATGTVTDVSCTSGLKMELSTDNGVLALHNSPGVGVRIKSTSQIAEKFTPCGLKGQRIMVFYALDAGATQSGSIEVIVLLDADSQN